MTRNASDRLLDDFWQTLSAHRAQQGRPPLKWMLPACGAHCRDGHRCKARATRDVNGFIANGRCRLHGGLSTGPRTRAGKRRVGLANRQRAQQRRQARELL